MNKSFILLLLTQLLVATVGLAQSGSVKTYTARVNRGKTGPVTKRDKDEITFQAKNKIDNLVKLLNALNTPDMTESERNSISRNSYLPSKDQINQDQIFYTDAIIVEDDIDPRHTSSDSTTDLKVDRYLQDLDLFYTKSDTATITFSRIITSPVLEGKDYPYIKVFFTSTFTGKHKQFDVPYQPVQRVAELRADKVDGKWRTFLTRLGFLRSGEGLTELSEPVLTQDFASKPRVRTPEFLFRNSAAQPDLLIVQWDKHWLHVVQSSTKTVPVGFFERSVAGALSPENVSIMLTDKDERLLFRRIDGTTQTFQYKPSREYLKKLKQKYTLQGWLQLLAGTAALASSYAGYSTLQRNYNDYSSRVNALSSEYAIWQTLTQQTGDAPAPPMSFTSYAQPGIYAVYGGGLVSSGLIVNGIRHLLKARKVMIPAKN